MKLPKLQSEVWKGGFVFEQAMDTCAVDARHGTVLAGGNPLVLVRAGEVAAATREPPGGLGPIRAVAVEPARRPRLAVCGASQVAVFDGNRIGTLHPQTSASPIEGIAWGKYPGGGLALYAFQEDGVVLRTRLESGEVEEIEELCGAAALASDETGALACAIPGADGDGGVYSSRDGQTWTFRELAALDGVGSASLAVAGDAVAVAIAFGGVWVSRGLEQPFVRCEPAGTSGPIAFEGDATDAALFSAVPVELTATIVRIDAAGGTTRIAELEMEVGEPYITALAWDASRRTLWGIVDGLGLLKSEAPTQKGKARTLAS